MHAIQVTYVSVTVDVIAKLVAGAILVAELDAKLVAGAIYVADAEVVAVFAARTVRVPSSFEHHQSFLLSYYSLQLAY